MILPLIAASAVLLQQRVTLDLPYAGTERPRQRLDLHLPRERPAGRLPVIVFIHGGGPRGTKAEGGERMMPLLRTGKYAGISIGYRPSGEAKWPAPLHDCKAAIRWIRAHADQYDFDPDRIGVWGRSDGADLALLLAATGDVPELEGEVGRHPGTSTRVACVVNFSGGADLSTLRTWITPGDAPVLTVHGTEDRTVPFDQALKLHEALGKAGVPRYLVAVKGGGHGQFGRAAMERVEEFFGRYLLGDDESVSTDPIDLEAR